MKKTIVFSFLILGILFISGCKEKCESELYTSDGKCCTYVCDIACEGGYKEGTCNCECKSGVSPAPGDTNIDDIFDDTEEIEPPQLPSP